MPADPRDFKLDLSSGASSASAASPQGARPYISVHFKCCGVYQRIYRSADATQYAGHCPRCAKPVRFKVGEGGTTCRFFSVS